MISDGASEYEKNTDRVFPVVILEGVPAPPDRLTGPDSDHQPSPELIRLLVPFSLTCESVASDCRV